MPYCGYITRLKNVRPHPNADRLLMGDCFGNTVIVSLDYTDGQLGVYFPEGGQLCQEFCEVNNLLRKKDENGKNIGGYMDERRRVTAVKLRGEKSDGLFLPLSSLANFTTISDLKEGETISVLNGVEICKKYIPIHKGYSGAGGPHKNVTKVDIAPTFYPHVETNQLAYYLNDFREGDIVELTCKMHGTSGRTGYLPVVKMRRSWLDKILRRPGKQYSEYDYVTGSRKVVLTPTSNGGYYGTNEFRYQMEKKFRGKLYKGETVYYEIVGFVDENTPIMPSVSNKKIQDPEFTKLYGDTTVFSYGCDPDGGWHRDTQDSSGDVLPRCEVYVYRMTMTNEDGDVVEYSPTQIRARCEQMAVNVVPHFETFIIPSDVAGVQNINPGDYVVKKVEKYFDGPDPIGKTHVREGVVARIVNRDTFKAYKHKNFSFKVLAGLAIDQAEKSGNLDNVNEDMLEEM